MNSIPNCIPYVVGNEKKYLAECVDTGWLSSVGPFVDRFERDFAAYHGVENAAAVSSGTAAVHLGLLSLGVQPGDYVLCPTITFVGSINPIKYCGADPILLEIDERTMNIDVQYLKAFLEVNTEYLNDRLVFKEDSRPISCLMVVHLYGNPVDMEAIQAIAQDFRLPVLEDAAESLGARYNGQLVGTFGDVGIFSFNGNKVVTSGGGGMIISRDPQKTVLCKHLSTQAKVNKFGFYHDMVGYNYRLSNLCAAVGTAQLENLDYFLERKRAHALLYKKLLKGNSHWEIVEEPTGCFGTYWMVLGRFKNGGDIHFLEQMESLCGNGIGVRPIWLPAHLMPLYKHERFFGSSLSETVYHSTICLPSSVGLTDEEIAKVVEEIKKQ